MYVKSKIKIEKNKLMYSPGGILIRQGEKSLFLTEIKQQSKPEYESLD